MKEKELANLLSVNGEGKVYFAHEGANPLAATEIGKAFRIEKYRPLHSDAPEEYSIVLIGKWG